MALRGQIIGHHRTYRHGVSGSNACIGTSASPSRRSSEAHLTWLMPSDTAILSHGLLRQYRSDQKSCGVRVVAEGSKARDLVAK